MACIKFAKVTSEPELDTTLMPVVFNRPVTLPEEPEPPMIWSSIFLAKVSAVAPVQEKVATHDSAEYILVV